MYSSDSIEENEVERRETVSGNNVREENIRDNTKEDAKPLKRPESVSLQIVSDIHLSARRKFYEIPPAADYLLICGDIESYFTGFYYIKRFLSHHAKLFKKVIWTLGNHEIMAVGLTSVQGIVKKCKKIAAKTNTIFLNNSSYELVPGLVLIGSLLYSKIPMVGERQNKPLKDSVGGYLKHTRVKKGLIPRFASCNDANKLHEEAKEVISHELAKCADEKKTAVVMTHFGPLAPSGTVDQRNNWFRSAVFYRYYSTDEDMQPVLDIGKDTIGLWAYGHDHENHCFRYTYPDGTGFDVVSNQLGNASEPHVEATFRPGFVYEVAVRQAE